MLDLESDYAILSAHSKMAAATPPLCTVTGGLVYMFRGIFMGTWSENGGRDLPTGDVAYSQLQAQWKVARSMERWFSDLNKCGATAGARNSCQFRDHDVRCRDVNATDIYIYWYIHGTWHRKLFPRNSMVLPHRHPQIVVRSDTNFPQVDSG